MKRLVTLLAAVTAGVAIVMAQNAAADTTDAEDYYYNLTLQADDDLDQGRWDDAVAKYKEAYGHGEENGLLGLLTAYSRRPELRGERLRIMDQAFENGNMWMGRMLLWLYTDTDSVMTYDLKKALDVTDRMVAKGYRHMMATGDYLRDAIDMQVDRQPLVARAEAGDTAAMMRIAEWWGLPGAEKEAKTISKYLFQAAEAGHPRAMTMLGANYYEGSPLVGGEANNALAMHWIEKSAVDSNPYGVFSLGTLYDEGIALPYDEAEAHRLYGRAAKLGSASAYVNLASEELSKFNKKDIDYNAAALNLKRAAALGHPRACVTLVELCMGNENLTPDYVGALEYTAKGVERGMITPIGEAIYAARNPLVDSLTVMNLFEKSRMWNDEIWGDDETTPDNYLDLIRNPKGVQELIAQAAAGDEEACNRLCIVYETGIFADQLTSGKYIEALEKAYNNGQYWIAAKIVDAELDSDNPAPDYDNAQRWIKTANALNDDDEVALFEDGLPQRIAEVKKNRGQVAKLEKKAQAGDIDAAYGLAVMSEEDFTLPYNPAAAYRNYLRAGARGHRDAAIVLSSMLRYGLGCQASEAKANYWLRKSQVMTYPEVKTESAE